MTPRTGCRVGLRSPGFNLYWLGGERKDARVLIVIRKDFVNRVVIEKRSDLIDYLYVIILDIRDFD